MSSNRRQFLRSASGLTLGLPLLPSLMSSTKAFGQTSPLKFFIAWHKPNGAFVNYFWPTTSIDPHGIRDINLASLPAGQALSLGLPEELSRHRDSLALLRGIDSHAYNSTAAHVLNNVLGGRIGRCESIDHLIARHLQASTPKQVPLLPLANIRGSRSESQIAISRNEAGTAITTNRNPYAVYLQYFQGMPSPDAGDSTGSDLDASANRKRQWLLDLVRDDIRSIRSNRRLSKSDRLRLDQYLTFMEELERKALAIGRAYSPPQVIPIGKDAAGRLDISSAQILDFNAHLAAAAVISGLSHCVSIGTNNHLTLDHDDDLGVGYENIHTDSHVTPRDNEAVMARVNRVLNCDRHIIRHGYTRILDYLKDFIDPITGKTMLSQGIVMHTSEVGFSPNAHYPSTLPIILAGGEGFMPQGQVVDYRRADRPFGSVEQTHLGRPIQQLFASLCQGFGMTEQQYSAASTFDINASSAHREFARSNGKVLDGLPGFNVA